MVSKNQPPFSPPPGLEPQFIMTPDAAPLVAAPANNTLNRWLIVHGSLMLGLAVIQLVILIFCEAGGLSIRFLFTILMFLFQLGWVIYGGIILFNDTGKTCKRSLNRKGYTVWQTTLAMWILNLIGLPALIITIGYVFFDD